MNNCIERNKTIIEYMNNVQSEINPKKSIYIKKYFKTSSASNEDDELLKTEYINNISNKNSSVNASNAKKMISRKKKIFNNDYLSDNYSTNRNFNKLITKSQTAAKTNNNRQFDKILLNTNEKSNNNSFLSGLNPSYIKTKYLKDVSTITNYAKKTTKYTFDLIKNNTNINYENSLDGFVDLVFKICTYFGKFVWIILCNLVLLIKSIFIIFVKYLNRIFSTWKRKNGLEDSTNNLSLSIDNNNNNQKHNRKYSNIKNNNIKKENIKNNNIKKENIKNDIIKNKKDNSGNKFINLLSNGINSINNFFNNSFPQANISLSNNSLDNLSDSSSSKSTKTNKSYSSNKNLNMSDSLKLIPGKKKINTKRHHVEIDKSKIMKYYPIKINNYESYNSDVKRKRNKKIINLKVGKKLGKELKKRIKISNLKTKRGIKKSINEIYDVLG
jgi:hypothetical protein